jgi:hypothetical protein
VNPCINCSFDSSCWLRALEITKAFVEGYFDSSLEAFIKESEDGQMKAKAKQSPIERAIDELRQDGYTVIHPEHNGINSVLADLDKANLSPREVEDLCKTAKCVTLNGFIRYDSLPCGCGRIYKGMVLGCEQTVTTFNIKGGGLEGVKPCPKHQALIESIKL